MATVIRNTVWYTVETPQGSVERPVILRRAQRLTIRGAQRIIRERGRAFDTNEVRAIVLRIEFTIEE